MIIESLQVLFFGMVGVFIVMGIIVLALSILKRFGGNAKKSENGEDSGDM